MVAGIGASQEVDAEQLEDIRSQLPAGVKNLRACLQCRIILTKEQFFQLGCPNCRESLPMQESEGRVVGCTTANFAGFISLIKPGAFVSRYNGIETRPPGCYALTVRGTIPEGLTEGSQYEQTEAEGEEEEEVTSNLQGEAGDGRGLPSEGDTSPFSLPNSPQVASSKRAAGEDSDAQKRQRTQAPESPGGLMGNPDTPGVGGQPLTPGVGGLIQPLTPSGLQGQPLTPSGLQPLTPGGPQNPPSAGLGGLLQPLTPVPFALAPGAPSARDQGLPPGSPLLEPEGDTEFAT
mmetsp:Transcript_28395/g.45590  ORF Transcript_28395/g.45590 Transcript_28395/m.45590 type:complete len:291 (-) Transcript_28395:82-954(-)